MNRKKVNRAVAAPINRKRSNRSESRSSAKRRKIDSESVPQAFLIDDDLKDSVVDHISVNESLANESNTDEVRVAATATTSAPSPQTVQQQVVAAAAAAAAPTLSMEPMAGPVAVITAPKKRSSNPSSSARSRHKKVRNPAYYKDLGRWKPVDDLALILNVHQTSDLKSVHLGTRFSCRFTLQEVTHRWSALMYDTAISRVAAMAMRNLHPETIAYVYKHALWSSDEEDILAKIKTQPLPTIGEFEEILQANRNVFLISRTPKHLQKHWHELRKHNLLAEQQLKPLPTPMNPIIDKFQDAENSIYDGDLVDTLDPVIDREIRIAQRKDLKEIRYLENELSRLQVLVNYIAADSGLKANFGGGELDNKTLAVLRGKLVRYLMRSKEVTLGRNAKDYVVDIDLSLEGPAVKISRLQGTLRYRTTGEFFLMCDGKRPFFVNGKVVVKGDRARLRNNSVIEVAGLQFIFTINSELIDLLRQEALKLNLSS